MRSFLPYKLVFLAGLMAFLALPSSSSLAADSSFCKQYADQAIAQFKEGQRAACKDLDYPVWSTDFDHHFNWCLTAPMADAQKGMEQRVDVLDQCVNRNVLGTVVGTVSSAAAGSSTSSQDGLSCEEYANNAVNQQRQNLAAGCGITGPAWNASYSDHFSWCMHGENLKFTAREHQARQDTLVNCVSQQAPPGSVIQIPFPQPQAPDNKSVTPIPFPSPAIDPGVGGKILNQAQGQATNATLQPLSTEVARMVAAPISRDTMVTSLLSDAATRSILRALPNLQGASLPNLAFQTLEGVYTSDTSQTTGSNMDALIAGVISPSSEPKSASDFEWSKGVHFSPFVNSPAYFSNGQQVPLSEVYISGVTLSNAAMYNAADQYRNKVAQLGDPASMELHVALPDEPATYMLSFKLFNENWTPDASGYGYQGDDAVIKAYSVDNTALVPLVLTPLSDGSGFVTVVQFKPQNFYTQTGLSALNARLLVTLENTVGFTFGGFTLTRL